MSAAATQAAADPVAARAAGAIAVVAACLPLPLACVLHVWCFLREVLVPA